MMYQCGRCGLIRASGQEMGVIQQCKCPWEFTPPVMQQAQQRTWVGLTESDRRLINFQWQDGNGTATEIIDLVEAKLKEKNT